MKYFRYVLQLLFLYQLVTFDWSNCTQGDISSYKIATVIFLICGIIFLLSYIVNKKIKLVDTIVIFIFSLVICFIFIKKIPVYFYYTNIKNISLCQGSVEYGGFNNEYNFLNLPIVKEKFEYFFAPLCTIGFQLVILGTRAQIKYCLEHLCTMKTQS